MPYMLADKKPDAPLFEGEYRERLDKVLSRYPTKQAALLPALGLAQEIRGHVSPESMDEVAEALGLSPATYAAWRRSTPCTTSVRSVGT